MVPLHGLSFRLGFKIMNPAFVCHKKISPSVSKHSNNSGEMAIMIFSLCWSVRFLGTHFVHTQNIQVHG